MNLDALFDYPANGTIVFMLRMKNKNWLTFNYFLECGVSLCSSFLCGFRLWKYCVCKSA
jgi:hypothetical protein